MSVLCKSNLHHLLCRLGFQVQQRGLTAHYLEYWVERLIGQMKKLTKNHIHSAPEKLMVSAHLFEIARRKLATAYPLDAGGASGVNPGKPKPAINATDVGATMEMGGLLGDAKKVGAKKWGKIAPGLKAGLQEQLLWTADWSAPEVWDKAVAHTYTRALVPVTGHEINSRSHTRSKSRIGYYVMQSWEREGRRGREKRETLVADVQYFIRIEHPTIPGLVFR
jgi:hypothetical protein